MDKKINVEIPENSIYILCSFASGMILNPEIDKINLEWASETLATLFDELSDKYKVEIIRNAEIVKEQFLKGELNDLQKCFDDSLNKMEEAKKPNYKKSWQILFNVLADMADKDKKPN